MYYNKFKKYYLPEDHQVLFFYRKLYKIKLNYDKKNS